MINKRTVLILGAGASMPYGFPSGQQLIKEIYDNLEYKTSEGEKGIQFKNKPNRNEKLEDIKDLGFSYKEIEDFRSDLRQSNLISIDTFLINRHKYMEIGKIIIAQALMKYEIKEKLTEFNNHWYKYLWQKMIIDTVFDNFESNKISFITFNYDRSLEQFLFSSIKATFGKNDQETANKLKSIPIIHVYGKLGDLPWQNDTFKPYEPILGKYKTLKDLGSFIRIIYDDKRRFDPLSYEYSLLENSENIYFLGFGYHRINIYKIGIGSLKNKTFHGTTYNLTELEVEEIKNIINERRRYLPVYLQTMGNVDLGK